MKAEQIFTGAIGQVARKISNYGIHTNTKPESQLQEEFYRRTGIWAPLPMREWLEHLLDTGRFTIKELRDAEKRLVIEWDVDRKIPLVDISGRSLRFAYMWFSFYMAFLLAAIALFLMFPNDWKPVALLFMGGFGFGWQANTVRNTRDRHRVALRIAATEANDEIYVTQKATVIACA